LAASMFFSNQSKLVLFEFNKDNMVIDDLDNEFIENPADFIQTKLKELIVKIMLFMIIE